MKTEAQRIAIAEACGWKSKEKEQGDGVIVIYFLSPEGKHAHDIPDYPTDLNAMHEAGKIIDRTPGEPFGMSQYDKYWGFIRMIADDDVLGATAAQRAEAFLRTIGKWTDGESEEKK